MFINSDVAGYSFFANEYVIDYILVFIVLYILSGKLFASTNSVVILILYNDDLFPSRFEYRVIEFIPSIDSYYFVVVLAVIVFPLLLEY
jgi:hypothetical protein